MNGADFTPSLYLGPNRRAPVGGGDAPLTTGLPAALGEPARARRVAAMAARLAGADAGLVSPSSLHALMDVLDAEPGRAVLLDAAAYPIAHRAAAGRATLRFGHFRPDRLEQQLIALDRPGLIMTDGFCTGCNRPLPLHDYLHLSARHGAMLLIDDTQGFGILGPDGGGVASGLSHWPEHLVVVASAAKAFGVPCAVTLGSRPLISALRRSAPSRLHASPPSNVDLECLERALSVSRSRGRDLRNRLAGRIAAFRRMLRDAGTRTLGSFFPVVTIPLPGADAARALARHLGAAGVRALARRLCRHGAAGVSFCLTVGHGMHDLKRAAQAVGTFMEERDDIRSGYSLA